MSEYQRGMIQTMIEILEKSRSGADRLYLSKELNLSLPQFDIYVFILKEAGMLKLEANKPEYTKDHPIFRAAKPVYRTTNIGKNFIDRYRGKKELKIQFIEPATVTH